MPRSMAALLSCLCLCVSTLTWAAPPPVAAYGQTPAMQFVALSPSGNLLAWFDNGGAMPLLHIFDLAKGAIRKHIGAPPDSTVRDLSWFDEETLFVGASMAYRPNGSGPTYEWYRTISVDIASGQSRILLHSGGGDLQNVTGSTLLSMRTPKPKTVIMASWDWSANNYRSSTGSRVAGGRKDEGWTYNLFEVNTVSGKPRLIEAGTPFTNAWVLDADGQPIARGEWQADRSTFKLLYRRDGTWSEIFSKRLWRVAGRSRHGGG